MQNVDYVEIGKRIRKIRKEQRLTQEEAAEKCDITAAYYGNVERGDKKMSVETLVKISKGMDISIDYLLFGDLLAKHGKLVDYLSECQKDMDEVQMERCLTILKAVMGIIDKL